MSKTESIDVKDIKNGMFTHNLESWEQFVEFVKAPQLLWPTLIYRGHANADWKIESTLDRLEKQYPTKPNLGGSNPTHFNVPRVDRKTHMKRFKELARGRLVTEIPDSDDEWWALAQHHGLATPMLDWTYSPFVSLYFAFELEKCHSKGKLTEPEKRAVFALAHHLVLERAKDTAKAPRPFVPTGYANYRLANQAGLFLRMPEPEEIGSNVDLESYFEKHFESETFEEPKAGGRGNLHPRA
ncbi:MAG: FRG domain-containing protein, partial [Sedimentisphaerales bacterium]